MKHICKELGTAPLGHFQLTNSLFGGLDSGAYDRWLQSDSEGKQAMEAAANSLMQKHGIRSLTPKLAGQPWYRKLLAHRNGASL